MPKKYLIVLFFMAFAGARHAVPLQGLPLLSDTAFAATQENGQPCPPECVIDSMEIITYYPSPYGYYEELRGDKIIVGDTDNSRIDETHLPPPGTITFEPMLDDPDSSDGNLYEGSLYYQGAIGGTKGKFRFYDGLGWQDLGGGGDYWKPSIANTDDIYYNTGNVGIGVGESNAIGAKLQINMSAGTTGLVVKSAAIPSSAITQIFNYTGAQQTYTVPVGITQVTIVAYGASGGNGGGLGGQAAATVSATPGETLYIYVGGQTGYNGGGAGGGGESVGRTGGGASDVRRGGNALSNRIIVAAGGGGGGGSYYSSGGAGGAGGGATGGAGGAGGCGSGCCGGAGGADGTQVASGAAGGAGAGAGGYGVGGAGGSAYAAGGGGGGGGYWGGGGGQSDGGGGCSGGGGGGGSGYVTGIKTSMKNGLQLGDGQVVITPVGTGVGVGNITEWQDVSGTVLGVVTADGRVGIKTATPDYTLTVNGTAWVTYGSWTGSDLRWKKNIEPLPDDTIDRLIKLDTIYYNYNNELFQDMRFPSGRQIGLSAQNVEKQFPELVLTDKDGYKAVAYDKLGAVTIEAIKEQQKEIEQLKESLRAQEEKSRENQDKLRKQQKEIELLKAGKL